MFASSKSTSTATPPSTEDADMDQTTSLYDRLMAECSGRQQRSQVARTIEFLRFVADDMQSKRDLRRRYARNTIAAYRRHLAAAGVAPIQTLDDLSWLMTEIGFTAPDIAVGARLLWVLNDDRHRSVAHAEQTLVLLVYETEYAERAASQKAA